MSMTSRPGNGFFNRTFPFLTERFVCGDFIHGMFPGCPVTARLRSGASARDAACGWPPPGAGKSLFLLEAPMGQIRHRLPRFARRLAIPAAIIVAMGVTGAIATTTTARAQTSAPDEPGVAANWNEPAVTGLRRLARRQLEGLVHARQRRAGERLLPGDRHPGHLRPAVRRDQRLVVHRPGDHRHDARHHPGRPDVADLAAGQHRDQRRLHDHQDLRRRPVALGDPGADDVRQHDSSAAQPVCRLPPVPGQRRDGQHRRHRLRQR